MATTMLQPTAADRIFEALGDSTRRAIVNLLSQGPKSVSSLAAPLGITLTAVAQHLQVLHACGLLRTEKKGRVRMAEIDRQGFAVLEQWVAMHRAMWETRLDRLGDVMGEDGPE